MLEMRANCESCGRGLPADAVEETGRKIARNLSPGRLVGSIGRIMVSATLVVIAMLRRFPVNYRDLAALGAGDGGVRSQS